ncbi:MAG TPA: rhodanese-like domain-containing protein [Ramlibacter sp.]|uniref:rhodanese-like domain-containing protein n=1 Tax=Ramlibacter sp. TaxID=1917967 RepID=UPI002BDC0F40|nr:rhodanese-like domain-containing protein [Ramlibacter sp.]HVZ42486.1 rhodanese-like domain-containing protein [Ramlibacter sp.]
MKFVIDNWLLIVVALTSGGMLLWPVVMSGARGSSVGSTLAVQLMNREKAIVIDVSEAEEFASGHVAGARNVPVGQLEQRLPEVAKNKSLPLIFVCPTGARANRAVGVAQKLGYERVQALAGGLNAWKEANLPVEKG